MGLRECRQEMCNSKSHFYASLLNFRARLNIGNLCNWTIDSNPGAFLNLSTPKHFQCRCFLNPQPSQTVRVLELDNLPVVGFRCMSMDRSISITIHRHHLVVNVNVFSCRALRSVWEHIGLFWYCFQQQMEHQFTPTEGVIINQTLEHTVVLSCFFVAGMLICQLILFFHVNMLTWPPLIEFGRNYELKELFRCQENWSRSQFAVCRIQLRVLFLSLFHSTIAYFAAINWLVIMIRLSHMMRLLWLHSSIV